MLPTIRPMLMASKLRALIFDVDGTLADTERDGHRVAFNQAFAGAGCSWNWSESLYGELLAIAGGKERIRHYLDHYCSNFEAPDALDQWIADLHTAKNQHYKQLLSEGRIPLRPGVKRLIQEAKTQQMRLAIATTSALPNVIALLETTLGPESPSWFEVIAAGDVVPNKKPAPDIYHYVLDKMGLTARECLVFEDSHHGLQAASQAGIRAIVTVNGYTQGQDFADAVLVLNHLGDPDDPLEILKGQDLDAGYLDLEVAHRVHEWAWAQ